MPLFLGSDFKLQSVTQIGYAILRVVFTQDVLAASSSGANDCTNPDNYRILGPVLNVISEIFPVASNPRAIDLYFMAPLIIGHWRLEVTPNIADKENVAVVDPKALEFEIAVFPTFESVGGGAKNDAAENILRKHLNPGQKGKGWDALIAGLASGDAYNWNNAKLAFDQLFITSANGRYLDRKAGDQGVARPVDVGMGDNLFRRLAIDVTASKLTQHDFWSILDIFYGTDAVSASSTTDLLEPYFLNDGDDLRILIDEDDYFVVAFERKDFAVIKEALAIEVSTAITRKLRELGSPAYAVPVFDPESGANKVRIYSGSYGLASSVRVLGGKAQTRLQFAILLFPFDSSVVTWGTWNVTPVASIRGARLLSYYPATKYDLNKVQIGDYVALYGSTWSSQNQGTYKVLDVHIEPFSPGVYIQWVDIDNDNAVTQLAVPQTDFYAAMFFRPRKKTIHDNPQHCTVAQEIDEVDIVIPATTQAVQRHNKTAAYTPLSVELGVSDVVIDNPIPGYSLTTTSEHGLAVGDWVIVSGITRCSHGYNGTFQVAVIYSTTSFSVRSYGILVSTGMEFANATVTKLKAERSSTAGPFTWDTLSGLSVTGTEASVAEQRDENRQYIVLSLQPTMAVPSPALKFPDAPGYLAIDFGNDNVIGPIKYNGRLSDTELKLDFSFVFPRTVAVGSIITLLNNRGVFSPSNSLAKTLGSFYVTAAASGRIGAEEHLRGAMAAGLIMNTTVTYPGSRGLGGDGYPTTGAQKITDQVAIWAGNDPDEEVRLAHE